ncbi:MAG: hypothetical protein U0744_02635 [Gemmataceae bacterium]
MTPDQMHLRTQRLIAFLASRGLPQDGGFTPVPEPEIYPNSAFASFGDGSESVQVNFSAPPSSEQIAAVIDAANAWDDSAEAQTYFDRQLSRVNAAALLNSDDPICVVIRGLARVVMASVAPVRQQLNLPVRSWDQLLEAVQMQIDNGSADA